MASSEFEWTFKGANIESSTEENPTVVYEKRRNIFSNIKG